MSRRVVRHTIAVIATAAAVLAPGVAHADPPGPTDYRTTIVSISPAAGGVQASIIGGDSFVHLDVAAGTTVEVVGYAGEPYLEFLPSGEVRENRRSISYFTSRSRYGEEVPFEITAETPPAWTTVAGDGRYAWHDHRAHWMNDFHPPGREPGDRILEAVIPILVDGREVAISVESTWLPPPSRVPLWLGLVAGVSIAAGVVVMRRHPLRVAGAVLAVAALATVVGTSQYLSVPAEAGAPVTAWLHPVVAAVLTGGVLVAHRWLRAWVVYGAIAGAGSELLMWAVLRRDGIDAAILPTNAPFWIDRGVTVVAALVAVAGGAVAVDVITRGSPQQITAPLR